MRIHANIIRDAHTTGQGRVVGRSAKRDEPRRLHVDKWCTAAHSHVYMKKNKIDTCRNVFLFFFIIIIYNIISYIIILCARMCIFIHLCNFF